jgi:uncharacterized membrane protein YdjX (TVP38/TMEM64 family)
MRKQIDLRKVIKAGLGVGVRIGLLIAVVGILKLRVFDHYVDQNQMEKFVNGLGVLAPLGFVVLMALTATTPLPTVPFIALGVIIFGLAVSPLLSLVGLTIGSCAAFLSGRYIGGSFADKLMKGRLKKLSQLAEVNGVGFIFSLRLIFFARAVLNYATGLTKATFKDYLLGTVMGFIPRVYLLSWGIAVIWQAKTIKEMVANPYIWSLLLLQIGGVLLLMALTRNYDQKTSYQISQAMAALGEQTFSDESAAPAPVTTLVDLKNKEEQL